MNKSMNETVCCLLGALALLTLNAIGEVSAAEVKLIKMATIAPRGSVYHRVLQEVGEAFRRSQGNGARAIIYPDRLQGSETDTVRRMRVGQLDASMLTVIGLSEIDRAVTALQYMPMMFRSWEEVDYVREKLRSELEARLEDKGFLVLMWGEGGWVQFFSKHPIRQPDEYKDARIFAWADDHAQIHLMKSLGYQPVGLPITDILPALETGMIDTVPAAPLLALAGQFDRVTRYMLPVNWVPVVGATVFRKATFDRLPPETQQSIMEAAREGERKMREHRAVLGRESVQAMQKRGLTVLELSPEIENAWRDVAEDAWPMVRGSMVPAETFDKVQTLLAEYRKQKLIRQ